MIPPQIIPESRTLGAYFDGSRFYYKFTAIEADPAAIVVWSILDGELPPGVYLNQAGELYGYLNPNIISFGSNYNVLNNYGSFDGLGYEDTPFSPPVQGIEEINATTKYSFSIRAAVGLWEDIERYSMSVTSKRTISSDSSLITSDNTVITPSTSKLYTPLIINPTTIIPTVRADTFFLFQIIGQDFDGDTLSYNITGGTVPAGTSLNSTNGWITGHLSTQIANSSSYTFTATCQKFGQPDYTSLPITFTGIVLGAISNTIVWQTPASLGNVFNGAVSELYVAAITPNGLTMRYTLVSGSYSRLPNGIKLLDNGLLVGRFPFKHFTSDKGATTYDKQKLTFDTSYTFTVHVEDYNHTVSAEQTFVFTVVNKYPIPYENIYMTALMPTADRNIFMSIVNNTAIFPTELIYRQNDTNFGLTKNVEFLFLPGLEPTKTADYIAALHSSHYLKRINLGNVKTAVALDSTTLQTRYEVVYVDVVDDMASDGQSLKTSGTITTTNAYYDRSGTSHRTMTPNSLYLMQAELANTIGYANKGALPTWMTNQQPDGTVLGLTSAVILAYTVPGASSLIAYRLNESGIVFNNLSFEIGRYNLDNHMTSNFDIANNKFYSSAETSFDRLPHVADPYAGSVQYATNVPYELIHNHTVTYIESYGGFDMFGTFKDGDKLVFNRQENYETISSPEWVISGTYYSDNTFDAGYYSPQQTMDYSSVLFAPGSPDAGWHDIAIPITNVVPGYLAHIADSLVPNKRMGIWQINIDINGLVTLSYVGDVLSGQYVQVCAGRNYRDTKIYFNPVIDTANGFTVPAYSLLTGTLNPATVTTFDMGSTKYYSYEDVYTDHGADDKYLKFQHTTIFN